MSAPSSSSSSHVDPSSIVSSHSSVIITTIAYSDSSHRHQSNVDLIHDDDNDDGDTVPAGQSYADRKTTYASFDALTNDELVAVFDLLVTTQDVPFSKYSPRAATTMPALTGAQLLAVTYAAIVNVAKEIGTGKTAQLYRAKDCARRDVVSRSALFVRIDGKAQADIDETDMNMLFNIADIGSMQTPHPDLASSAAASRASTNACLARASQRTLDFNTTHMPGCANAKCAFASGAEGDCKCGVGVEHKVCKHLALLPGSVLFCLLNYNHIDPNNKLNLISELIHINQQKERIVEYNKCNVLCLLHHLYVTASTPTVDQPKGWLTLAELADDPARTNQHAWLKHRGETGCEHKCHDQMMYATMIAADKAASEKHIDRIFERSFKSRGDAALPHSLNAEGKAKQHLIDCTPQGDQPARACVHCRFCHKLYTLCEDNKIYPSSKYFINQMDVLRQSPSGQAFIADFDRICVERGWDDAMWTAYRNALINQSKRGKAVHRSNMKAMRLSKPIDSASASSSSSSAAASAAPSVEDDNDNGEEVEMSADDDAAAIVASEEADDERERADSSAPAPVSPSSSSSSSAAPSSSSSSSSAAPSSSSSSSAPSSSQSAYVDPDRVLRAVDPSSSNDAERREYIVKVIAKFRYWRENIKALYALHDAKLKEQKEQKESDKKEKEERMSDVDPSSSTSSSSSSTPSRHKRSRDESTTSSESSTPSTPSASRSARAKKWKCDLCFNTNSFELTECDKCGMSRV